MGELSGKGHWDTLYRDGNVLCLDDYMVYTVVQAHGLKP